MQELDLIFSKLPDFLQRDLRSLPKQVLEQLEEIHLKTEKPIYLYSGGREFQLKNKYPIDAMLMQNIFHSLLDHSAYAYQEELAKGYITVKGGHRIGVCGRTVIENGEVMSIKDISSLNIRRSREIKGISDKIMHYLIAETGRLYHTVIVSPPKCGKTTLLRDIIRNASKIGLRVGVCDERSEIAGLYQAVTSFDLGDRTDVLDGCPKEEGMIMLIRTMSPDVIATDEIGKKADLYGIETALCAGVSLLTTIHGQDYSDVLRSGIGNLASEGIIQRYIFLSNRPRIGTITSITGVKNSPLR